MDFLSLLILAIGLSMDAFAVSICKGLSLGAWKLRYGVIVGLWVGAFQALMPAIGYLLGVRFAGRIEQFDHWIAFVLLFLIGANMIREAFKEEEGNVDASLAVPVMFLLAVATSIDALAIGVTFAFLRVSLLFSVLTIGITTFVFGVAGVYIGCRFGARHRKAAQVTGGVILIIIGVRILVTHLGLFPG